MHIGSNAYARSLYGGNGRIAAPPQNDQDAMPSATPQPNLAIGTNVVFASQATGGPKAPSAALASAVWQMMVRRSNDGTHDRLVV